MRLAFAIATAAGAISTLAACGPDDGSPADGCEGRPVAAFRVVITAAEGPLPDDTVVVVKYGGGEEEYRVRDPPAPDVVFCRSATRDGGPVPADASTGGVDGVSCKLWTNGAATLTIRAGGYVERVEELEAMLDEKCNELVTREVEITLSRDDAGTS